VQWAQASFHGWSSPEAAPTVPVRFAIASNRENPGIDRVLFENQRLATVEKLYGAGANIAPAPDPRR
jgi:hypothetical protein